MNQTMIGIVISVAVIAFLIWNHFKPQNIDFRIVLVPSILAVLFVGFAFQYPTLKGDAAGLALRFLLGLAIGVLQGCLAKLVSEDGGIVSTGTKTGLACWLIFVPVRLLILPWFSVIAPGVHNLENSSLAGIAALCIFTGFFLSKGTTLLLRKARLLTAGVG
ncbi:MAG TPA: hypothetical protein VHR42_06700 [Clostridia bacterium]|nr:hypothetical protein [Clostridia bacterium]